MRESIAIEDYNEPIPVTKTPMREEKFAMYASVVMLIILGIGVLGFVMG